MRTAFMKVLVDCARVDKRIWLLVGDLGYNMIEPFKEEFPDRFINTGIAEQNMIGVAAGLAFSGKIVFVYSISNFSTFRCLEQIRNDVCYHNANIKIVAGGVGLYYSAQGMTHHAIQDLAIVRALPNINIISPSNSVESGLATRAIINYTGPCYLRLDKAELEVCQSNPNFSIGKAIRMQNGNIVALIATGSILYNTMQAAKLLEQYGIRPYVLNIHTLKPLDIEAILAIISSGTINTIVTIEEHSIVGGLGSAVAEVLSELAHSNITFRRIGIQDEFCNKVGSREFLRKIYGLDPESIKNTVYKLVANIS